MVLGLSHSLEILSQHGIEVVGNQLGELATSWVLLSIKEPFWDVVVGWSGNDVIHSLDFIFGHFTGSLVNLNLGDFEGKESKSSTDTLDLTKSEGSLLFTVDVCVLDSQNMLKFVRV